MGTIIALVLLALAVLVTVVVLIVKGMISVVEGDIPVPRSSERTIEERIRSEVQEETEARRAETQHERERLVEEHRQLRIRAQNATGTSRRAELTVQGSAQRLAEVIGRSSPGAFNALNQALSSMGETVDRVFGEQGQQSRPGVEVRVTHTTVGAPQAGQKDPDPPKPAPATPHRKSRYERDPVI